MSLSSQVANVIPEPGEPVSRLLEVTIFLFVFFFSPIKSSNCIVCPWLKGKPGEKGEKGDQGKPGEMVSVFCLLFAVLSFSL